MESVGLANSDFFQIQTPCGFHQKKKKKKHHVVARMVVFIIQTDLAAPYHFSISISSLIFLPMLLASFKQYLQRCQHELLFTNHDLGFLSIGLLQKILWDPWACLVLLSNLSFDVLSNVRSNPIYRAVCFQKIY